MARYAFLGQLDTALLGFYFPYFSLKGHFQFGGVFETLVARLPLESIEGVQVEWAECYSAAGAAAA